MHTCVRLSVRPPSLAQASKGLSLGSQGLAQSSQRRSLSISGASLCPSGTDSGLSRAKRVLA